MTTATQAAPKTISIDLNGETVVIKKLLGNGDSNVKLAKNETRTYGLSLSPANVSGIGNTCPHASAGCKAVCLDHQGQGSMTMVQRSRMAKTHAYYKKRPEFMAKLEKEIDGILRANKGKDIAIRLNVFSDLPWEQTGIFDKYPQIQGYDYTKNPRRVGSVRKNYWVTFSRSETNEDKAIELLKAGKNVAVVFYDENGGCGKASAKQQLPKTWNDYPVLDGDLTDLRYEDKRGGYVVGLRLKAKTRKDRQNAIDSGFAVLSTGCK
jgi:hypothetical protein